MQVTGIIRKIDDLGRIVLPKELRKYLNINSGDDFLINIDNNKIVLEKYSKINNTEEIINIINIIQNEIDIKIYLVVNSEIINNNNEIITKDIQNIINERKTHIKNNNNEISISKNIKCNKNMIINPIILNGDILGTLILISNKDIQKIIKTSNILDKIIRSKYM